SDLTFVHEDVDVERDERHHADDPGEQRKLGKADAVSLHKIPESSVTHCIRKRGAPGAAGCLVQAEMACEAGHNGGDVRACRAHVEPGAGCRHTARPMTASKVLVRALLTLVAIAVIAMPVSGVHLHLCFDGSEPPSSVHFAEDGDSHTAPAPEALG